ncbi:MAG: DUF1501 domain-containing protein, partial [Planctomycetaceae bacterium]|nr:DUF1501 domain-containing protein [Planctomycetaceae bacterium]
MESRRDFLKQSAHGFGTLALAHLLGSDSAFSSTAELSGRNLNPLAPKPPHFAAKAKRVIYLYMTGGPSQVDTFDPKPELQKLD